MNETVWFLTIVVDGHFFGVTSIIAGDQNTAVAYTNEEFVRLFGSDVAEEVINTKTPLGDIVIWDFAPIDDKPSVVIRATLIKS